MNKQLKTKSIQDINKAREQMKKDYECVHLLAETGAQLKSITRALETYIYTYHQDPAVRQLRDDLARLYKTVLTEQSKRTDKMYAMHMQLNHGK